MPKIIDNRLEFSQPNEIPYTNREEHLPIIIRLLDYLKVNFNLSEYILEQINNYVQLQKYLNDNEYKVIIRSLPGPLIENSIINKPALLKEWHYEKNNLDPTQVSYGSRSKVWWLCSLGHEWQATPNSRTRPGGTGCPYCKRKMPTTDNNLAVKKPHLVKEWHPLKNGILKPHMVLPRSNKRVWWLCKNKHEWQATIDNRFNGTNCPYCWSSKDS
ncbi:TPA: zinc-ribbon domain-containing protein [Legionella pneumophila]